MEKITKQYVGINYTGKVKISVVKNGKTLKTISTHNLGCMGLFNCITNYLLGNFKVSYSPQYLMIHHCEGEPDEDNLGTKLLNTNIYKASQQQVEYEGLSAARLRFLVPSSSFINEDTGNVLSLLNSNREVCAYVELDDAIDPTSLPVDSNLIIIWELRVGNSAEDIPIDGDEIEY